MKVLNSVLDLIGNTPLLELSRMYDGPGRLLGKAEFMQPGGSVKDRAAKRIIEDARADGRLLNGQPVVEMTSGNMGSGLAVVCNVYGHPFTVSMSAGNSRARAKMMEDLGVTVELVEQVDGKPGEVTGADIAAATEHAREIAINTDAFYVDQFNNPSSIAAHFETTGPEIWNALDGNIDAFVALLGSGGTYVGVTKFLKNQSVDIFCAPIEPAGAEVLAGKPVTDPRHNMQGTGYGIDLPHWRPDLADAYLAVTSNQAERYRKLLAEKEGLHLGYSSGGNVAIAIKLLESGRLGDNPTVVTVLCDSGLKYQ